MMFCKPRSRCSPISPSILTSDINGTLSFTRSPVFFSPSRSAGCYALKPAAQPTAHSKVSRPSKTRNPLASYHGVTRRDSSVETNTNDAKKKRKSRQPRCSCALALTTPRGHDPIALKFNANGGEFICRVKGHEGS